MKLAVYEKSKFGNNVLFYSFLLLFSNWKLFTHLSVEKNVLNSTLQTMEHFSKCLTELELMKLDFQENVEIFRYFIK